MLLIHGIFQITGIDGLLLFRCDKFDLKLDKLELGVG